MSASFSKNTQLGYFSQQYEQVFEFIYIFSDSKTKSKDEIPMVMMRCNIKYSQIQFHSLCDYTVVT